MEQKNIEHLCIYGKFEKNTNNIDVEEIIRASHTGFVFIVDNNKNSYYRDPIGGTVFIRKNYFDKFLEGHTVKYLNNPERNPSPVRCMEITNPFYWKSRFR